MVLVNVAKSANATNNTHKQEASQKCAFKGSPSSSIVISICICIIIIITLWVEIQERFQALWGRGVVRSLLEGLLLLCFFEGRTWLQSPRRPQTNTETETIEKGTSGGGIGTGTQGQVRIRPHNLRMMKKMRRGEARWPPQWGGAHFNH